VTSPALWIPQVWFLLTCSRPVSNWLNLSTKLDSEAVTSQIAAGNSIDRAVCTALIIFGMVVLLRRDKVRQTLRYCWPICIFLGYCLLSVAWSEFADIAFKRWIREVGDLVMILIVWTDPHPMTALKRLMSRAAYTLIPLSVLFCRYYPFGRSYGTWTGQLTYTGVLEDKNGLAQICLLFGLASIWQLLNLLGDDRNRASRRRHMVVHCAILVMVVYLFVLADSVTSRSCMGLATIVLIAARTRLFARRKMLVHLLVLLVVAIPVCVAILGASPAALQAMGRDSTLTDRTLIWTWVVKLVPNIWVGAGYGSFWLGQRLDLMVQNVTHTWVPYQAHNGYLDIFANLGWVGVALLGVVIVHGYLRSIRLWRGRHPAGDLMLAYFVVGVVSNITEASFFRNMFPIWLVFMLAITVPPLKREESTGKVKRPIKLSGSDVQYAFGIS
jgi:exopolysaccharide production protein ExoQ